MVGPPVLWKLLAVFFVLKRTCIFSLRFELLVVKDAKKILKSPGEDSVFLNPPFVVTP